MPHPSLAVANAVILRAAKDGQFITHMKLQKLMYYANGYYLAFKDEPLIDRPFEAWEFGPVEPSIYHKFKHCGRKPIKEPITGWDFDDDTESPIPTPKDDEVAEKVIDFVWKHYGKYSGLVLSDLTHAENSPWDITRKRRPGMKGVDIDDDLISSHFKSLIKKKAA